MSATKKQTAVQWLEQELINLGYLHSADYGNSPKVLNALNQAKAMEKEQIMDAFEQQVTQWTPEILEDGTLRVSNILRSADQYYNETYD